MIKSALCVEKALTRVTQLDLIKTFGPNLHKIDKIWNGEHSVNTEALKLTQSAALWIKKGEMTWTDLSFSVRNYTKYNYMRIDRLSKNESPRFTSRLFVRLCSTIPRFTSRRFCSVHISSLCTFRKSSPVQSSPV